MWLISSLKGTYLPSGGQSVANFWPIWDNLIIRERLDVIFVSNSLQDFSTETGIIPPYKTCSDHGIPFIKIEGFGIPTRDPGIWKFNNQLLSDTGFVSEMKEKYQNGYMKLRQISLKIRGVNGDLLNIK